MYLYNQALNLFHGEVDVLLMEKIVFCEWTLNQKILEIFIMLDSGGIIG